MDLGEAIETSTEALEFWCSWSKLQRIFNGSRVSQRFHQDRYVPGKDERCWTVSWEKSPDTVVDSGTDTLKLELLFFDKKAGKKVVYPLESTYCSVEDTPNKED